MNRVVAGGKGPSSVCNFCRKPGHWKSDCQKLKAKIEAEGKQTECYNEGAKKAEEAKAVAITEFAGQASAVLNVKRAVSNKD